MGLLRRGCLREGPQGDPVSGSSKASSCWRTCQSAGLTEWYKSHSISLKGIWCFSFKTALCILSWQELLFPLFFPMLNHSGISLQVSAWSLRSWVQDLGSPHSLHFLHLVPFIENFFWGFFPSNSHPGRSRSRRASEPLSELYFLYKRELNFYSQKPRGPATKRAVCYYRVGFKIPVVQLYRLSCRAQSVTL